MSLTYRDAGVDIDAGDALVDRIKPLAEKTFRSGVLGSLGGFGGLFALPPGMKEPILVSGTDGVGTKLKLAFATGRHNTIGIDLVAMCVNDIAVTGAEPLFFLDYFACGKLDVSVAEQVVSGIAEGCKQAGCALIGGETAELPGMYPQGEYDLAGFSVGVVEKAELIDGLNQVRPGDVAIGLASSGLHSNGYSLARKIFDHRLNDVVDALMAPTRIYVRAIQAAKRAGTVHGIAHITGGGLVENPPRILPPGTQLRLKEKSWPLPEIFSEMGKAGVDRAEMRRTFNMGLGLILLAPVSDVRAIQAACESVGEKAFMIGEVVAQADPSKESFVEFV